MQKVLTYPNSTSQQLYPTPNNWDTPQILTQGLLALILYIIQ